ncbi:tetratricopeptide repeat protein [Immundisolibacter sp.]|uniref:tetratricopeptide repeat protein n=1 Tax=Immundisolibacter sp. TaxID=1934948 RepID=UPI0035681349
MRISSHFLIAAVVVGSLTASAGDLEDGIAAFEKRDFNTAVRLIEPLAEQGIVEAEYFMGTFFMYGHGTAMDPPQAKLWFQRAFGHWETQAKSGNPAAMVEVAMMLTTGLGITRDDKAAVQWLRKASDLGYAEAWAELGELYVEGAGVPKDVAEGERLLKKASAAGSERADEMLAALTKRVEPASY